MSNDKGGNPIAGPKLTPRRVRNTAAVQEGHQDTALGTRVLLVLGECTSAPVGPFALKNAYDGTCCVGTDAIHPSVTAPADVHPDLVRVLKLEQGYAEMLKRGRSHGLHQSPFDLLNVAGPWTFSLCGLIQQPVEHLVSV